VSQENESLRQKLLECIGERARILERIQAMEIVLEDASREIEREKQRADGNFDSCERLKRKYEDATAREAKLRDLLQRALYYMNVLNATLPLVDEIEAALSQREAL